MSRLKNIKQEVICKINEANKNKRDLIGMVSIVDVVDSDDAKVFIKYFKELGWSKIRDELDNNNFSGVYRLIFVKDEK